MPLLIFGVFGAKYGLHLVRMLPNVELLEKATRPANYQCLHPKVFYRQTMSNLYLELALPEIDIG